MVRFLGRILKGVTRPQLVIVLLAAGFVASNYVTPSQIVRPAQVASIPVIRPLEQKVEAITIDLSTDCSRVSCLALTFDDGPDAEATPQVLSVLDRYHVKATFFLIGLHVPGNEAIVRRIHKSGHEIGNHSWSHRNLAKLSPRAIETEIARTQQVITAAGVPAPRLFRPPYGAVDAMVRSHISLTVVSWNVDPEDWRTQEPEKIVQHVLEHAKPGAIIDLHDIYPETAEALGPILSELGTKYHFVTVSQLLSLPPGQPGIFYSR